MYPSEIKLQKQITTSQTPVNLQQSVEYNWYYTDAHVLLFASKIVVLSDQFCLISWNKDAVAEMEE